jgi:hypothetical protein
VNGYLRKAPDLRRQAATTPLISRAILFDQRCQILGHTC